MVMDFITINGVVVEAPVSGEWNDGSISAPESGRDGAGDMQNDIITTKGSFPYTWGILTAAQTKILLQAVKMNGFGNINITTHNPEENEFKTYNCYASDRKVPLGFVFENAIYYSGISITFIEN